MTNPIIFLRAPCLLQHTAYNWKVLSVSREHYPEARLCVEKIQCPQILLPIKLKNTLKVNSNRILMFAQLVGSLNLVRVKKCFIHSRIPP